MKRPGLLQSLVRSFHYRGLLLVTLLIAINLPALLFRQLEPFDALVIHHSASETDNYESIRTYHLAERGWSDAAYHLILSNGSTGEIPFGHLEATGRFRELSRSVATRSPWYNRHAIHLCVIGDYENRAFPNALRAPLAHAVRLLQRRFGIADHDVLFHRECSPSKCPGRHLNKIELHQWLLEEAGQCPDDIRGQQSRTIQIADAAAPVLNAAVSFQMVVSFAVLGVWLAAQWHRGSA